MMLPRDSADVKLMLQVSQWVEVCEVRVNVWVWKDVDRWVCLR